MDFSTKAFDSTKAGQAGLANAKTECLVVGVFEQQPLAGLAKALDAASKGLLARMVKRGELEGKLGSTLMLHEVAGWSPARVLFVGLGREDKLSQKAFNEATRAAARAVLASRAVDSLWTLSQATVTAQNTAWAVRASVIALRDATYRFTQMKSKAEPSNTVLRKVVFAVAPDELKAARVAARHGEAIANGMALTKDLGNLPGNVCTPTYLADTARKLAREFKLKAEILGPKQIEALKMGSFLSVARGSVQPPQFIVLKYEGGPARQAPIVLVGKGVTFDTGGISLKPGEAMDEMKYDMCGAGSVLGTIRAVAEMGLKLNVIAVVPATENMPGGKATKPGDVVTSMSGQTIEVLNTDAEGRLILCDALTYAERFKPAAVIDVATLTGACIIALGHVNWGLFSKSDALADELLAAGRATGDTAWRLPVEEEYQEQLKSNFADVANIGGRPAGSVTAACFLARFTEKYEWAHLDIAGTAWKSGAAKGATGRPVPLLTQFLIDREAR